MKLTQPLLTLSATLLVASCTTLEPGREDDLLKEQTPEQFKAQSGSAALQTEWWNAFGSAQLDRLMAEAFAGSLSLEQAYARLEQAEATARKSGAAGKVQLDGKASASSRYQSNLNNTGNSSTTPDFTLGLYASYELDLWGKLKSGERAALATYEATRFDLQTAGMSLSAQLAVSYFTWQAQTEALRIYESQLDSNRNKLTAIERRYKSGQATSLAVLQQRQQVAATEARMPPVRARIKETENALAVLIGKIPGTDLRLEPEPLPSPPPQPAAGLPVDLLANRPDLQAARLRLESADWSVGVARAARLPSISLTGNITTSGEEIDELFDDWASNLAASLLAPLLDGGARKAEVDRTYAVSRERIAAYRLAVLEAIQETEDALNSERHQTEYVEAVAKQYEAAQNSESESIRRYQRGALPFLDALTAIVARESLEITHVQAKADLLGDRIQLYRSLGGDWTFMLEEEK
ncbi:Solvent efflux pump outer membrane protein SrpC [Pontiella desulfatans]|uniref:Solvent efflux pump outer membrane protein SrpC n=1 Tax=Pontiella desulfatans TaxID=2750659 RepID=A0A6C2UBX6_PONDE|nr:efflux transporter outer membrane subunit [Pontiella desulfatans]VGO17117.1 Solvent efflux pump outer membrane protein SrpC [Pontiella desulfatans]